MSPTPTPRRLWWLPEAKEALAFILGVGILVHQTVAAAAAQTVLVVAAVAMMGVLGSGVAQRALKRILEDEK
jgi:hypothetical protein